MTPEEFAAEAQVTPEALARLQIYDAVLLDWGGRHNLVGASTVADRWRRHYWDSAQLFPLIPETAQILLDLGSGAGFPGLVLAALGQGRFECRLVESNQKKAAFLREAARAMDVTVHVHAERAEHLSGVRADVITARALAPLPKLLDYAAPFAHEKTKGLFLKGQDVASELTEAAKYWNIQVTRHTSHTHPAAAILEVARFRRRKG